MSIKAATSGFGESKDLLSPMSLFQFTAVTRVKDPPMEESKLGADKLHQKRQTLQQHSLVA